VSGGFVGRKTLTVSSATTNIEAHLSANLLIEKTLPKGWTDQS
jgi:hypothetical protein